MILIPLLYTVFLEQDDMESAKLPQKSSSIGNFENLHKDNQGIHLDSKHCREFLNFLSA